MREHAPRFNLIPCFGLDFVSVRVRSNISLVVHLPRRRSEHSFSCSSVQVTSTPAAPRPTEDVSRMTRAAADQCDADEAPPVPFAAAKSFAAGAISGAIAKTSVAPFDRTKILMQVSQMYGWDRYRGSVWDSMKTIWRTEGPRGFFRGNSATVVRIMPYAAIQYSSFEFFNRILSTYVFSPDSTSPAKRFIAGAMAGTTSVLCTYPIDLARTVLAVQVGSRSRAEARGYGLFGTLTSIAREQGISSMYRGMYPTIVGVVPYAGISFLTYGVLRRNADRLGVSERAPLFTSLVCGGSAGLVAQCCTYPFDLVRRRLQALHKPALMTIQEKEFLQAARSNPRIVNSFSISRAVVFIVRGEGVRGLYRGVSLNFLKTAPAMSISFTCYDKIRTALGVPPGKFAATKG